MVRHMSTFSHIAISFPSCYLFSTINKERLICMAKDKRDLRSFVQSAGKTASDLLDKTKGAAQTFIDDHELDDIDAEDISAAADKAVRAVGKTASSVYEGVKSGSTQLSEKLVQARLEADRKNLRPIFADDIATSSFSLSKLIRLTQMDRKRAASEACQGSIGYDSSPKDVRVVNLYTDHLDSFGLTFYPDAGSEIYYVDPANSSNYIALEEYFHYMKVVRIAELQKLAQDLGAKFFRVTYKEEQRTLTRQIAVGKLSVKGYGSASAEKERESRSAVSAEIAAEMQLPGHEPIEPTLVYLSKDPAIQSLISLRMSPNPITHQKLIIHLSNSSGMKESEAAKIDAALGAMKCSGHASIMNEAQNESRRYLEYEIDF